MRLSRSIFPPQQWLKNTLFTSLLVVGLSGCDGYRLTLNEQAINDDRVMFSDYQIADKALSECVRQHIDDQQAQHAGQLSQLNCSHNSVKSLAGLEVFSQISQLDLSHNQLTDIAALKRIAGLKNVDLRDNPDLSCLQIAVIQNRPELKIKSKPCR